MNHNEMKKDEWMKYSIAFIVLTLILFFIATRFEDGSMGAVTFVILAVMGMILSIISVVKVNIYNAKANNMSADEYLSDRFANAIPETKETFGIKGNNVSIPCPVCGSKNIVRITTFDRAISVSAVGLASGKIGKQYKCKDCKHMW